MPSRSKIALLPTAVREELERRIVKGGFANYRQLAMWLSEQGYSITKDSVHRHGAKLEDQLEAIKKATAAARAITDAAPDDEGALNDALVRLVQEKIFNVLCELEVDPSRLNLGTLTRAIADLAKASVGQKRWQVEMRAHIAEQVKATEERINEATRTGGLSADAAQQIRAALLEIGA